MKVYERGCYIMVTSLYFAQVARGKLTKILITKKKLWFFDYYGNVIVLFIGYYRVNAKYCNAKL